MTDNTKNQEQLNLPTKAGVNVAKNMALIKKLMERNQELSDKQKSWIEKNLGEKIFDWINSPVEYVASKVGGKLPRWGTTNATRPNPLMGTIYPMSHGQGATPEPDSGQINNAFNAKTRLPNWSEINNGRFADNSWIGNPADNIISGAGLAKIALGPLVYGAATTPALAVDAIGTLYASLRNGYNALADYWNKGSSEGKANEQYKRTLAQLQNSLKEAEDAKLAIDNLYKSYNNHDTSYQEFIPADEGQGYSIAVKNPPKSFGDYVNERANEDLLNYIENTIDKIPNTWSQIDEDWKK